MLRIVIIQRPFPSINFNQVAGRRVSPEPQLNDESRDLSGSLGDVKLHAEETAEAQALWWYLALRLRAGAPDCHPPR